MGRDISPFSGNIYNDNWRLDLLVRELIPENGNILYPPFYQKRDRKFFCLQPEFWNPRSVDEIGQICKCEPFSSFSDYVLHLGDSHNMSEAQTNWVCAGCESIHTCQELFDNHQQFCLHLNNGWSPLQSYVIIFIFFS
jgi:hypothetical protein